ncbi:MAG: acyltransferase [Bacillota bacterium]
MLISVLALIGPLFFDRKYLRGRHFTSGIGWRWVWRSIWLQKVLGFNRHVPWPVSPLIVVANPRNLVFDPDDLNNFQHFGCYFQNYSAKITIGKGTYIAPNVGVITANHDPADLNSHRPAEDVVIGERCWIGMNSVILPGVTLLPGTIVAAGSVVNRSFAEGNCLIGGVPARVLKNYQAEGNSHT